MKIASLQTELVTDPEILDLECPLSPRTGVLIRRGQNKEKKSQVKAEAKPGVILPPKSVSAIRC